MDFPRLCASMSCWSTYFLDVLAFLIFYPCSTFMYMPGEA